MYRHVQEALTLNQERQPHYSAITGGKSIPVSKALIQFEKTLITQSRFADFIARPYQWAGIPIACVEYISMSETPQFRTHYLEGPPNLMDFRPAKAEVLVNLLKAEVKHKNFELAETIADLQIGEIEKEPRFNCLIRHLLESMRRVAGFARQHAAGSFISKQLLKGHLKALETASQIDRIAAPIQAAGVPIVCQDVPFIPPAH
jgi:hypothetical protein